MSGILRAALALAAISAAPAGAAQVFSTGYDTPNGNGQDTGGQSNYWDLSYSGAGAKTTGGAPLTGGSGDLTDGIVPVSTWDLVENVAGTGPYVGWNSVNGVANPLLTFYFSGNPVITSLSAHVDNSSIGGVVGPEAVLINGVSHAFTAPTPGTIGWLTITGLNLTGNSHSVQFNQADFSWVFVSEVTFDGTVGSAIPEPASWAMLIAGFGMVGAAMRRRRRVIA